MTSPVPHVCYLLAIIEHSDGGEPTIKPLHKGPRDECERAQEKLGAVVYNGDRPVKEAFTRIVPESEIEIGGMTGPGSDAAN